MKSKRPNASDWKLVLDFNTDNPMKIRQYFYKYTDSSGLSGLAGK
jgi:hypothetical protein